MSLGPSRIGRRNFLAGTGAMGLSSAWPRAVLADAPTDKRCVLIILRGAMDGMNVVVPYGDTDYAGLRGDIAIGKPGDADGALDLDGFYGLHPALAEIAPWYMEGGLLPIQAVASPYRDRSHFDGQDMLENGTLNPRNTDSGWLNRAIAVLGGDSRRIGLAVGQNIPLVMRGPAQVSSWAPSQATEADGNFLALVQDLYGNDAKLSAALAEGIKATATADRVIGANRSDGPIMQAGGAAAPVTAKVQRLLAEATGKMLAAPDGPRIAVFDAQGWDTHAGQGGATGRLAGALTGLSASLTSLRGALGPAWKDTVVIMATEFGRTAHANGTGGTDHGTATAALLAGGALKGRKVAGSWPGLTERSLYQGRDLMPTTDLRAVLKAVLADHLRVPRDRLDHAVFPNSADVRPMTGIIA